MEKRKQGLSQRAYAKHAGVSGPYVAKLVKRGTLPVLPDGSLDPEACDAARARYTNMERGAIRKRRQVMRHESDAVRTCVQCGAKYTAAGALADGMAARDIGRYCVDECERDAKSGLTPAETVRKLKRSHLDYGGSRADLKNPDRWLNYTTHYEARQ